MDENEGLQGILDELNSMIRTLRASEEPIAATGPKESKELVVAGLEQTARFPNRKRAAADERPLCA